MNKYDNTLPRKVRQENFIEIVDKFHNNKYDYSLIEYINNITKIKIICPIHGVFEQSPKLHKKYGCNKCSGRKKLTINEFINMSEKVHGNRYNYSSVRYKNNKTKVRIECQDHGFFTQSPYEHYNGQGCPKCGDLRKSESKKLTTDIFIKRSILIHNNFYNYSKVNYTHNKENVIINCPEHGDFEQKAISHLMGYGCQRCSSSKGELSIEKMLKLNNVEYVTQKTFENCLSEKNNSLRFDFYLPEKNLCIEYDGRQHFESIEYFGGEKEFKNTQTRDKIKNEYCYNNDIDLLRIPHYEYHNIEKIISVIYE